MEGNLSSPSPKPTPSSDMWVLSKLESSQKLIWTSKQLTEPLFSPAGRWGRSSSMLSTWTTSTRGRRAHPRQLKWSSCLRQSSPGTCWPSSRSTQRGWSLWSRSRRWGRWVLFVYGRATCQSRILSRCNEGTASVPTLHQLGYQGPHFH